MNMRFRRGHVLVLCVTWGLALGHIVWGAESDADVERLAKSYREAMTELERRTVCLEAIDSGVVARGHSVADVDATFGTAYAKKLPPANGELAWGVVDFHHSSPSPSERIASGDVGWYLAFQFDSAGKLQNYYLSNVHK